MTDLDSLRVERCVERLLAPFDRPDSPGCTIGIVREGRLVLHRSAGMASLEHRVPIGPSTRFRIASVTKQFVCAAALMLAREGRLRLEDDARDHLPEIAGTGERITVAHLMHNTSGLRDMLELMRMGGMDLGQPCAPADLLAAIGRQRGLNFAPGAGFLYSNTNFLLLGLIVERVGGESLGRALERRIFAPLGMNATRLVGATTEVEPDLATGYFPRRPDVSGGAVGTGGGSAAGYVRALHGFPLAGEGGLVSCVRDLALWDRNFETGQAGGPELAGELTRLAPFANGRPNFYARGLQVRDWRGLRGVEHGGLWPGFKTEFLRIPERRLTAICIANHAGADPAAIAHAALAAALAGDPALHPVPAAPPRDELAALAGRWLEPESGVTLDFEPVQDAAAPVAGDEAAVLTGRMNGVPFGLLPTEDGRLAAARGSFAFTARPAPDGASVEVEFDAGRTALFRRAAAGAPLPPDLAGRYASADMGAVWTIEPARGEAAAPEPDGMVVRVAGPHVVAGPWHVEPVESDVVRIRAPGQLFDAWYDAVLLRDAGGRPTGLRVSGGRVKNIVFSRQG